MGTGGEAIRTIFGRGEDRTGGSGTEVVLRAVGFIASWEVGGRPSPPSADLLRRKGFGPGIAEKLLRRPEHESR
jgi:hypothetical protein